MYELIIINTSRAFIGVSVLYIIVLRYTSFIPIQILIAVQRINQLKHYNKIFNNLDPVSLVLFS